jgi:hypothetical protein
VHIASCSVMHMAVRPNLHESDNTAMRFLTSASIYMVDMLSCTVRGGNATLHMSGSAAMHVSACATINKVDSAAMYCMSWWCSQAGVVR